MAIISRSEKPAFRRYGNTQFRYAMTYVFITFFVLLFLNIYTTKATHELFYSNNKVAMLEKCQLASDEIAKLEVMNREGIGDIFNELGSMTVTRTVVTDPYGLAIYDSLGQSEGSFILFPEVVQALDDTMWQYGNDSFSWVYHDGAMRSCAATPVIRFDAIIGCVYMTEYNVEQGALIKSVQSNVLHTTLILEIILIFFSLVFSKTFSRRLQKIMTSMRIIQEGDYSHKVSLGGNDELTVLGDEFNDLTERLQTSEQKRSRFVSDASHELKTPLASIKLLTDSIMQNDMDTETIREFVGDIGDEAERLNRVASKLLSLTKVDGEPVEESQIIPMAPTIRRVAQRLSGIAMASGITLSLDLAMDTPILILEDDLYQIVFNLIENGIKYNVPGGSLTVRLSRDEENAYLEVSDTGMGIPEDAIPHLFERFFRVDKARSRQSGGSGLGLAIVRAIIQRSRGDIRVTSVVGEGTTFTVSFPAFDTEVDSV
ncbi:MAG: HAMP domain-containing histidine kinase [Ruminococcaceae bacterium]|nr:HAMP domain-containing histidine kinase [Oscillospiraceae bacterium]